MGKSAALPCPTCATRWVDHAVAASGVELADPERRRLIAALLARPHLLLSGPAGVGKRRLARALARAITDGRPDRVRVLKGHPWWAAQTGDVTRFVTAQMNYNVWRLVDFAANALRAVEGGGLGRPGTAASAFVVYVEGMSPGEIDFYFRVFVHWWPTVFGLHTDVGLLRIFGAVDSSNAPDVGVALIRDVAVVHLTSNGSTDRHQKQRGGKPVRPVPWQRR